MALGQGVRNGKRYNDMMNRSRELFDELEKKINELASDKKSVAPARKNADAIKEK